MRLTRAAGVWRRMAIVFRKQFYRLFGSAFHLRPLRQRAKLLRVSAGAACFFDGNSHCLRDSAMWRIPSGDGNGQQASNSGTVPTVRVCAVLN